MLTETRTEIRPLEQLTKQVRIVHDFAYAIDGADRKVPQNADPLNGTPLVDALKDELYGRHYTRPLSIGQPHRVGDRNLQRRFLAELASSTTTRESWIPGATIVERREGKLLVKLRSRTVLVDEGGFVASGMSGKIRSRPTVEQPAWFYFFGTTRLDVTAAPPIRLYWNVGFEGASAFVKTLSSVMNVHGIPFEAKLLKDPQQYRRADAAVSYLPIELWPQIREALPVVHQEVAPYLRSATPLFTLPLGHGLGLAEDPGIPGESFGQHRCRLVAQGLWKAFEQHLEDHQERVAAVRDEFRKNGVDPDFTHRSANSVADYRLDLPFDGEWNQL